MSFHLHAIQIKVTSRCLSAPDATSLHHCVKNKQLKLNAFSGKDPAKGVFSFMHSEECVANTR